MGYQVVKCPKCHLKSTRAKSFRCHGRIWNTESHVYDVAKEPPQAQKQVRVERTQTPKPRQNQKETKHIRSKAGPTTPTPLIIEVSHA